MGQGSLKEILRELLAEDKGLIADREALLSRVRERADASQARDINALQKAMQSANVGELLLAADTAEFEEQEEAKAEAKALLLAANMQEKRADFVLDTLVYALHWEERKKKVLNSYESDIRELNTEIEKLRKELAKLKENIRYMEAKTEERFSYFINLVENVVTPEACTPRENLGRQPSENYQQRRQYRKKSQIYRERIVAFVADFNDLRQVKGVGGFREARQSFMQKYKVEGFKCNNVEERVNNPEIKPVIAAHVDPVMASLWGTPLGDNYAVLPNLNKYEWYAHSLGGMKELFDSNYDGGSYNNIVAIAPAIFTQEAILMQNFGAKIVKGKLVLS